MAESPKPNGIDVLRAERGRLVVITALGIVLAVFVAAIARYTTANEAATAITAVTAVIGTVVGAYFGIQAGSQSGAAGQAHAEQGRTDAEARAKVAEERALTPAAHLDPTVAASLLPILGLSRDQGAQDPRPIPE